MELVPLVNRFITARTADGRAQRTLDDYRRVLDPFIEWCLKHGVSPEVLTRLIQDDKLRIRTVRTHDGQIMLDEGDIERMAKAKALRDKIWEKVAKFEGETVSTQDARDEYKLGASLIYRCIEKGYIRAGIGSKGGRGKKRELNKADVAYVAELAKRNGGRGHRLFGPDTIPPHAMGA